MHVDLASIRETAVVDADGPVDLAALPWPEPERWIKRLAAIELVAVGGQDDTPPHLLRLIDNRLYLDRYWTDERQVARDLVAISARSGRTPRLTCCTSVSPG